MNTLFAPQLFGGLIMVGLGIGLGVYLTRRFQLGWRLWWIGAAGFVISQVGHIPFNSLLTQLFQQGVLPAPPEQWKDIFNSVVLGLSAGMWEELTRAAVFRWWAKDARSWRKGVLLGAGHGGIEAILLGVLVLGTFVYMASLRGMDLTTVIPPEQLDLARQQIDVYWSTSWPMAMLGPLERALTIPCHIAFSVLVLQAFTRKQPFWVGLAVLWHALMDAVIVYLAAALPASDWNSYILEGVLAVFTAASITMIFGLKRPEPAPEAEAPEGGLQAPVPGIKPEDVDLEVTKEDLDRSRYS